MKKRKVLGLDIPPFTVMLSVVGGLAQGWPGAIAGALFGMALDTLHPR
ncbi:MAG: hypothetical protein Q7R76_06945 [Candidatus Woesearchaeota archaeon]|nr:hypothetical protein [Candidatus Woesearchaeota archaeon]